MNNRRLRTLSEGRSSTSRGPVVYWMSRDQRVHDNWALLFAQQYAKERRVPLVVAFCLVPDFLGATIRAYEFMIGGLEEVEQQLHRLQIGFQLFLGGPVREIPRFLRSERAVMLVADSSPLRINREWKTSLRRTMDVPFIEVDAHNIVPCWHASSKQEFGAYTIRPKIHRALPEFLEEFPPLRKHRFPWTAGRKTDWQAARASLRVDASVGSWEAPVPGAKAARRVLKSFLESNLASYNENRNDPNRRVQSHLSPYLHFGQISPHRVALEVKARRKPKASIDAFLEELIVRRELADNFCFYNDRYDSFGGFPAWAQKSLNEHRNDRREHLYTLEQLEFGRTHDPLWNAAQREMTTTGSMHGYLRMYWAKKILEWTRSPDEALAFAITLNDWYELDGRDPNGYAGIAWSIGGVHDRAWGERRVFGKIRYMSYEGCRRKFDVDSYIERWSRDAPAVP